MAFQIQWRRFNFFDREILKDQASGQQFDKLKGVPITSCASGRGYIITGDTEGNVYILDRDVRLTFLKAYEIRVTHVFQMKQHNILVTVGEDEQGINPMLKVWNFDKLDRTENPTCCRIFRAILGNKPVPVSCITVHENLSQMAIGFEDGSVLVLRGDVTKERNHSKPDLLVFRTTAETDDLLNKYVALYFYHPEGRGPCLAFEGEKKLITWFRGYLVVVSKEVKQLPRSTGSGVGMNILTVYDIQNKFIAYTAPFPEIIDVLGEWGYLHVITSDGKMFQLEEKDTQTKLETLFKKNMYDMAISLAKSQHYSDGLIEIFRQYGDHLYSKGDHDGAIQQYIRTIGHLEASYVIRKFLDAQRIHNLTDYLQALHEKGLANTDHTTLLLNCYTKLKAVDKLNDFIKTDKELNFDVETAIKVCRQAGYFKHALDLSEKYEQHDWYLKIQLEDIKDYKKALKYIGKLPFIEAEANMKNYGKTLVNEVPDETTELLKKLCTDYKPKTDKPSEKQTEDTVDYPGITAMGKGIGGLAFQSASIVMSPIHQEPILRAKPDEFIHIFVHQKKKLKEFLEHMVKVRNDCQNVVFNTLIELYLHDASRAAEVKDFKVAAEQETKCLDVFKNTESKYDLDHAMVLAQMHNFKKGILYLYEKAKLFQQILRYHMDNKCYDDIIEDCKKYGRQDPSLWSQALSYFARKEEDCKKHIMEVLDHIDKYNLLSPLLVVQTLAHNSTATLAVIKDYIVRRLQHENEQIQQDERMIRQYRDETEKMRNQIEELKTCAKIFQSSKCMICNRPLELPAVHFLCGDSFHQPCFESYAENDNECPVCMSENRKVMDIIKAQENNKDLHEQFHHQLERSADGFSVVADYFGRGVFNKVTVLTDTDTQQPIYQQDIGVQRDSLLS